jgi:hypothetical protein
VSAAGVVIVALVLLKAAAAAFVLAGERMRKIALFALNLFVLQWLGLRYRPLPPCDCPRCSQPEHKGGRLALARRVLPFTGLTAASLPWFFRIEAVLYRVALPLALADAYARLDEQLLALAFVALSIFGVANTYRHGYRKLVAFRERQEVRRALHEQAMLAMNSLEWREVTLRPAKGVARA